MKYAVIRLKGHQHKVTEGEDFLVDYLGGEKPSPEILLISDGDKVDIGTPILEKAKITLKILEELEKGKKIHVQKFKAKSRYRKKIGHRPKYTRLQVGKITSN